MTGSSAESNLNQFLSVLGHLGWGLQRVARPQPFPGRRRDLLARACWVALSLPDGQPLLILSLEEPVPDLASSFKNYEDFALLHRLILRAMTENTLHARYLLMLGTNGAHLIDLEDEDVLIASSSREETGDRLLPLLDMQSLTRGALTAFPRKTIRQRARELSDWTNLWSARIGSTLELTQPVALRFFDWIHLSHIAEINRIGPPQPCAFEDYPQKAATLSPRKFLEDRFRPLYDQWFLLQENALRANIEIAAESARTHLLGECLLSHGLLSRGKFSSEVIAEAFADEELRLRSWRSSLVFSGPSTAEGEAADDARWLTENYTLDLDQAGYVVMLRAFETLVEIVRRVALDRQAAVERGERPGMQLDLLAESPPDIPPHDAVRHVLKNTLRITTSQASRIGVARTALLAKACELQARYQVRDVPFPRPQVEYIAVRREETAREPAGSNN